MYRLWFVLFCLIPYLPYSQLTATADYLARQIVAIKNGELFELLSDGNGNGLPLVAWKLKGEQKYDGESQLEFTFQHYI